MDEDGIVIYPGNMAAQLQLAMDNAEAVLNLAGYTLGNTVRLNIFTTDIALLLAEWTPCGDRLSEAGCAPASSLFGVTQLAHPDMLVEIEITAAK